MKKILLLPCFFISLASFAQIKLTIQKTGEKCAVVSYITRSKALGDLGFEAEHDGPGKTERSFLQFDLSVIPMGSKINFARLSLFGVPGKMHGSNSSTLRRITSAWDPATVTWNTQPTTTKRDQVKLVMSTNDSEDYKSLNVNKLLQTMVDSPAVSFGLCIKLDTETENIYQDMFFYSPALGDSNKNPKLYFEYTQPGLQQKVTTMSVDLNGSSTEMNIYPNPCRGIFNCNIKSASADNMTLRVIDMIGRTVYRQFVNTSNLQLRVNLPLSSSGTYFVILQDNKNATLISQQLQVN